MRSLYIGTGVLIAGVSLVMPLMFLLGCSKLVCAIVGISVSSVGFVIQMYSMFSLWNCARQEQKILQERHEMVMEKIKELPPEEAIELLLQDL